MGPSGSGKTTLVTLLTGKIPRSSGVVKINGRRDELSNYSRLIGYVPQEDIMLRELTVRETLIHSARTRLPRDWDYHRIKAKVLEIIEFLGISHVSHTVIGDEETRGISGGQRKRVNIGMELVAEPSVLFLDEPTSGLDSSTAFEVCQNLRNISEQQGLTVAAVIHSPSMSTFAQFHDIMLLGRGGRVVYMGSCARTQDYFYNIGFSIPTGESPSDFYIDVVSGKVASEYEPSFELSQLFDYWDEYIQTGRLSRFEGMKRMSPYQAIEAKRRFITHNQDTLKYKKGKTLGWFSRTTIGIMSSFLDAFYFLVDIIHELSSSLSILPRRDRYVKPFRVQFYYLMKRAILQSYKNSPLILSEMMLHFLVGIFISISVKSFDYLGAQPRIVCSYMPLNLQYQCSQPVDLLKTAGQLIFVGAMFSGISVGINTFGREKVVIIL
jgi:ABC-type multidrug transport system ATPase subunit